jgi:hypothetical protein
MDYMHVPFLWYFDEIENSKDQKISSEGKSTMDYEDESFLKNSVSSTGYTYLSIIDFGG